jgi:hypothetical protein
MNTPFIPIVMTNQEKINRLLTIIENIIESEHSSETQVTAKEHEKKVGSIFQSHLDCEYVDKDIFRNLLTKNGIKQSSKEFKNYPPREVTIEDSCGFSHNKNYIIHQPFGSQAYPDFVVVRIIGHVAKLCFIECKQEKPTWNNTPPKKCKNCLYVCGNKIYNGYIILGDYDLKLINDYKESYEELVNFHNSLSDEVKFVMYKKIETAQWPTKYFIKNQNHNIDYIHETLSRFY